MRLDSDVIAWLKADGRGTKEIRRQNQTPEKKGFAGFTSSALREARGAEVSLPHDPEPVIAPHDLD